jgi:hypothetical protein
MFVAGLMAILIVVGASILERHKDNKTNQNEQT